MIIFARDKVDTFACRFLWSIRTRLILLLLIVQVPVYGLILYSDIEQREHQTHTVQDQAMQTALRASSEYKDLIEDSNELLATLAQIPDVRHADSASCNTIVTSILKQYPQSHYSNIGVIKPDGTLVCSAVPVTGTVNMADRSHFQRALLTHAFAIGEFQIGVLRP